MIGSKVWQEQVFQDEEPVVQNLLHLATAVDADIRKNILTDGQLLARRVRAMSHQGRPFDAFVQEFQLSSPEGVALMCLAESLLRIPDRETADRLIAERIQSGNWKSHLGRSNSLFVNAATWGLLLTGSIVRLDPGVSVDTSSWIRRLVQRLGEPAIRSAMSSAMRLMGRQYVLGTTIDDALKRGMSEYPENTAFSFDMLGEGARTATDAKGYLAQYESAINAVAKSNAEGRLDSVSIKLSALHPRYQGSQRQRVFDELLPCLVKLCVLARARNVSITVDAEEAERLALSLELFGQLARHPLLSEWDGLGLVLQAYQKQSLSVVDWIENLARETNRRIPVRLVKGAYWDTEIKRAQELGLRDYPVYTRKENTDLAWFVCAQKLISAGKWVYPQFATHNAYSIAVTLQFARQGHQFELQHLHGMGDSIYAALRGHCNDRADKTPATRVYAPVGDYHDLLPYLVRRLLENGGNSSFVNQLHDRKIPIENLVQDVVETVQRRGTFRNMALPRPPDLYLNSEVPRRNAAGLNLEDYTQSTQLFSKISPFFNRTYSASPTVGGHLPTAKSPAITCPSVPTRLVGRCREATTSDVRQAMQLASAAQKEWDKVGGEHRANVIESIGRLFSEKHAELTQLVCREAGRTLSDAHSEIREAIDFCYYYAAQARRIFGEPQYLDGPTGETNRLSLHGRGVFACISPWNFPLAIFTGQAVAALAAGNAVAAKPAEQTPLIAARVVELMFDAGVPKDVLQLLPGRGDTIGRAIINDRELAGVAFTGSTTTAKNIQRALAEKSGPIIPLIAETGGLNALIADTSCLPEQLVDDVITSAFKSAGQRCSSLRVLFLPEAIANTVLAMLYGACDELKLGDPLDLSSDIGPIIDARALEVLRNHISRMREAAKLSYAYKSDRVPKEGHFLGPHVLEIDNMACLEREVFGPILHVVRYKSDALDSVLSQINECGYGLTLGVHSRVEGFAEEIFRKTHVGNTYVNRNIVGAVVGVNPFGGDGLSGTGPKAGGPQYLLRFATERTMTVNTAANGGNVELLMMVESEEPISTGNICEQSCDQGQVH